jgi:glycosyltransferase involved in cell wall biosynthesis
MRILHLLASPFYSGPADGVAQLALAQRALGHEVTVAVDVTRTQAAAEELAAPRLRGLGLLDEGGLGLSVKGTPLDWAGDARRLRARALDVVHAHFSHDHLLAWAARPRGARLVRSIHAPRSVRRLMPGADGWTVPWAGLLGTLGRTPVRVLPPLVAATFQAPADRPALQRALGVAGAPLVGMVSTFKASRRHGLGLEAFRQLRALAPGARLVLVGDGELEGALRGQVAEAGLEHAVHFAGYQSGEAFVRWLQALDVAWVLGLGNDWAGRAAAEARACGVRVVAVDEGGLGSFADAVVAPDAPSVVAATLAPGRAERGLPSASAVATEVLALYGDASR